MKKLFLLIATAGFLFSCDSDVDYPEYNDLLMDKPAIIKVFCQASPNECFQEIIYEYQNSLKISETVSRWGEVDSRTTYEYNAAGRLKKEVYEMSQFSTQEKEYFYNETNRLEKIIYTLFVYNSEGEEIDRRLSEETYEYENNLLVRKVENWGGVNTYDYDEKGRMITHTNYERTTGEKYHIFHFTYKGNLKTEEKAEIFSTGRIMYIRKFNYDKYNRLTKVLQDDKTVEANVYKGNRLIEKRINYYGIDPGFSACNGNFIYKYEY